MPQIKLLNQPNLSEKVNVESPSRPIKNLIKDASKNFENEERMKNLLSKKSPVVFLGGKAETKLSFFETIEYFNSLSNNKE